MDGSVLLFGLALSLIDGLGKSRRFRHGGHRGSD